MVDVQLGTYHRDLVDLVDLFHQWIRWKTKLYRCDAFATELTEVPVYPEYHRDQDHHEDPVEYGHLG